MADDNGYFNPCTFVPQFGKNKGKEANKGGYYFSELIRYTEKKPKIRLISDLENCKNDTHTKESNQARVRVKGRHGSDFNQPENGIELISFGWSIDQF